jgi:hypothetical protein
MNGLNFESFPSCEGDIAPPLGNGIIDVDDLLLIINTWGPCN